MINLVKTLEEPATMSNQPKGQALITGKDERTWLSLNEALDILGMKKATFYYYRDKPDGVRTRNANNNKDKQYNAADVKRLKAKKNDLEIVYAEESETELKWLVPADLPAILRLDFEVFSEYLVGELNLYSAWITKNKHVALCVFDKLDPNKCLAYISALPLPEQLILKVLKGEMCELDIKADDILTYDEPGEYTLLVNSVVASEEKYLNRALNGVLDYWESNAPERKIKRLYAEATSERGRSLLRRFYFSEVSTITDKGELEIIDDAYYLDLQRPAQSKIIRDFQQRIKAKE
jgi:hypothetical protein